MSSASHRGCRQVAVFQKLDKIGEGTYGSVYKARDRSSGAIVALKRVKLSSEGFDREGMPQTSLREVGLLRRLRHPNIVQLLEVVVGTKLDSVFLVFEFCEHDLGRLLDAMPAAFSPAEVKCLLQQLLSAVAHLHGSAILHRDLKLSNLLLTADGTLKLCDFGLARQYDPPEGEYTGRVVTLWYRAPELLFGARAYGAAVDMWAVGCIFGELLLHKPLMPGSNELRQLELMVDLLGAPNERIWPEFRSLPLASSVDLRSQPYNEIPNVFTSKRLSAETIALLNAMLTYDPNQRISAPDAQAHEYFRQRPHPQRRSMLACTLPPEEASRGRADGGRNSRRLPRGSGASYANADAVHRTSCAHSLAEEGEAPVVDHSAPLAVRKRKHDAPGRTRPQQAAPRPTEDLTSLARLPSPSSIFASTHRQL